MSYMGSLFSWLLLKNNWPSILWKRQKTQDNELSQNKVRHVTSFNDLPDELVLLICRYLSPAQVLKCFSRCNARLSRCIEEYRQNIDLTKCSYNEFQLFLDVFVAISLQPTTIKIGNQKISDQFDIFLHRCMPTRRYLSTTVRHLSLLEYSNSSAYQLDSFLEKLSSLQSLHIIQSMFDSAYDIYGINKTSEIIRQSMFNSFPMLTELELIFNKGVILDKQLRSNHYLTRLLISLQNINDLYVLLDGLVPNLQFLRIILCQSNIYQQSLLPPSWPSQSMLYLKEFQLLTEAIVSFTFDQLCNILTPLNQLEKLMLHIPQLHSANDQFIDRPQLEMLMQKFSPQLHDLTCFIRTKANIDMQVLTIMNERWPMKCQSKADATFKHLYTVPYSFMNIDASILADDDTTSICPIVQCLVIDKVVSNMPHHFPNIHTLRIEPDCNISSSDYLAFRYLRHLSMTNIDQVPSSVIRRLHTLALSTIDDLVNHPVIYHNIEHFIVKNNQISSSILLTALGQHFPRIHILDIQLLKNNDYYDNLNILLDEKDFPQLSILKTNRVDTSEYSSNIDLWLKAKTRLKWRSTPFHATNNQYGLMVHL